MLSEVVLTKHAEKQLKKVPIHIKEALYVWAKTVIRLGPIETRKLKGYHDEPLKGKRVGERSIRLNRAYRAIYIEGEKKGMIVISIIEVNKHDY